MDEHQASCITTQAASISLHLSYALSSPFFIRIPQCKLISYHFAEFRTKYSRVLETGSLTSISVRLYWETRQTTNS